MALRPQWVEAARQQAEKGVPGKMEYHAGMTTMVKQGSWRQQLTSGYGWTVVSHFLVMNWVMLWKDIAVGLLISGTLGALLPNSFCHAAFFNGNPLRTKPWGPVIGPLLAIASTTCSIGNVPLAAVLWNGGSSFGWVVAFIYGKPGNSKLLLFPV